MSIHEDLPSHQYPHEFQGFLEAAPDAVVAINAEGRIVIVNSLTEKMFGYSRQELMGQFIELLVPERYRGHHIAHRDHFFKNPKTRPMGEGRALQGRKKNGSEFPVEISLSPLKTEGGVLITSIIRDITQRTQLEAKFRGLLESAPDGIVVVDTNGNIVIVNSQTEIMFGYNRDELLGRPVEILVPIVVQTSHVNLRNGYIRNPKTRPMGAGRALTGKRKDNSEFPIEISLSPLETGQGLLITSIIRDITERRRAEEQIQASLREKEALLKEIHHRVKNNLQVTSSLLRLQSNYVQDPKYKDLFLESQNRIRSMALVHEKLYQSKQLSKINFPEYVMTLSNLLFRSFGVDPYQIRLTTEGEDIFLSIETAVPCGLVVNEILSNSLKHAFPNGRKGHVNVRISKTEEPTFHYRLEIADDGVGLPENFNLNKLESLGLQLVQTLTQQLNGKFEIKNSGSGTVFFFDFQEIKGMEQ